MRVLRVVLAVVILSSGVLAGDTKVKGTLFAGWNMDLSENADNSNSFELTRAYLTATSKLSEQTSVRITADLRNISGFDGYTIVLKYGYFDWKPNFAVNRLSFRFGLQPTPYISYLNKVWGRRYLQKTASDLNKFLSSADLGASANIRFGATNELGALHLVVFNGTAYTDVEEENKQKDFNAIVALKPAHYDPDIKGTIIVGQFYYGTQNMPFGALMDPANYRKQMISGGGRFSYEGAFELGTDISWLRLGQGALAGDLDRLVLSAFGTIYLEALAPGTSFFSKLNLFGRFDSYDPNSDLNNDKEKLFIGGLECISSSDFKAALNVRIVSFEDATKSTLSHFFVNTMVIF